MGRTSEIALKQPDIYNVSLPDTSWVKFTLPNDKTRSIMIQCRDKKEVLVSTKDDQSVYWTIKKNATLSMDTSMIDQSNSTEDLSFWVKTTSPTTTIEIMVAE